MREQLDQTRYAVDRLSEAAQDFVQFSLGKRPKPAEHFIMTLCTSPSAYFTVFGPAAKHDPSKSQWSAGDLWVVQPAVDEKGNPREFLERSLYLTAASARVETIQRKPDGGPVVRCNEMQTHEVNSCEVVVLDRTSGESAMLSGSMARGSFGLLLYEDATPLSMTDDIPRDLAVPKLAMMRSLVEESHTLVTGAMNNAPGIDASYSFLD